MSQTWRRLTFLHWPYEPSVVQALLPSGLEVDTFADTAWVGLVPFEIHNLRSVRHFPETNVRTYVIGPDGSRAVWFFSLDAARLAAVIGARVAYHLPYVWATMRATLENATIRYRSRRKWPHAIHPVSDIVVKPGERYRPDELGERDHFLTARYRLYSRVRDKLAFAQVEHEPWPLARATLVSLNQNLIEAVSLPSPRGAPLVHYCEQLDVKIGYLVT
ncbi:MAG TPA: DUF2071 domain-containing protein [Bryobacteraceae bacterium]|nr:DUF2071 domain-containing protein [Bryobacteraceae bacterium]